MVTRAGSPKDAPPLLTAEATPLHPIFPRGVGECPSPPAAPAYLSSGGSSPRTPPPPSVSDESPYRPRQRAQEPAQGHGCVGEYKASPGRFQCVTAPYSTER